MALVPTGGVGQDVDSSEIQDGAIMNADINASAGIELSKLESIATARLLGRNTAGSGAIEQLSALPTGFLASTSDVNSGTESSKVITPDVLAGSDFGVRLVQVLVLDNTTAATVTNEAGDFYYTVPEEFNGYNLVFAHASVGDPGTTGTQTIQIHNVTDGVDMLSTRITIDSGEATSYTAATPPVIDTANDDVATGDQLRFDIDTIHAGTAANGTTVILGFQLP